MLNYYQIVKRKRDFKIEEISELWSIADDDSTQNICKVGAFLLLDQQVPAARYYEKLDEKMKQEFIKTPIWHFWNSQEAIK